MRFKKILVPVDFSHFSKKALEAAVELAKCCGGKIFILHVEEDIFHIEQIHKQHPPLEKLCDDFHDEFIAEKNRCLEEFKAYIPKKLLGGAELCEGHPFIEIVTYAQKKCVDLIVISHRGRNAIKHVFLGSTAEKVSRQATCPVLLIKDKECASVAL